MEIKIRRANVEDIERCLSLIPMAFLCDPHLRACFHDIWRRWLMMGSLFLIVLEDLDLPKGNRLVAFGSSAFVKDKFFSKLKSGVLGPGASAHAAQAESDGETPFLRPDEIRAANSSRGLNLFVTHIGWDERIYGEEGLRQLRARLFEAFAYSHAGYQIKDVLQEVYSDEEMFRGIAIGARVRSDYSEYYTNRCAPLPAPKLRPYLIGCSRAEVLEGSALSGTFEYQKPRLRLRIKEQQFLLAALDELTDQELAQTLEISASTVQKRWLSIYDHVAEHFPDMLPAKDDEEGAASKRGAEKRRHLLRWLRRHPEELRPHMENE